jgi:hypothetical protein
LLYMPLPTYQLDRERLFALIKVWDHGCETPHDCPHKRGAITRFAGHLGRHRESFWKPDGTRIRRAFAVQIATALGKEISDFTLPDEPAAGLGQDGAQPGEPDEVAA